MRIINLLNLLCFQRSVSKAGEKKDHPVLRDHVEKGLDIVIVVICIVIVA